MRVKGPKVMCRRWKSGLGLRNTWRCYHHPVTESSLPKLGLGEWVRDHKELQFLEQDHRTQRIVARSHASHCQLELEDDRPTLKPALKV